MTYGGNCHCGAFVFTVALPSLDVLECNCSLCGKHGTLWVVPGAGCFNVKKGGDGLREYRFGKKECAHKFCPGCGTSVMAERDGKIFLNARTLRDVDFWAVKRELLHGASFPPAYTAPVYTGPALEPGPGEKVYTGGCHCGAATIALRTKPLPEVDVRECNCSICTRNGYILVYPTADDVRYSGDVSRYQFGKRAVDHMFCGTCGVALIVVVRASPEISSEAALKVRPVNLRVLDGVEWEELKVTKFEGGQGLGTPYAIPE